MALLESVFSEIRLPEDLYNKYVSEMKESYGSLEGVADGIVFGGAGIRDISAYPTFDVKIPGALLHLPPQLYFVKKTTESGERYFLQIMMNHFEVDLGDGREE